MDNILNKLIKDTIIYEKGNPHRIHHFCKVLQFAQIIIDNENIDEKICQIIEIAAVLHDVGIKPSIKKYDSKAGNYQEIEGPPVARLMLKKHGVSDSIIERVIFLIANHHTYNGIQAMDHRILIEADYLVNIFDHQLSINQIEKIKKNVFKTKTGIWLLEKMYLPEIN